MAGEKTILKGVFIAKEYKKLNLRLKEVQQYFDGLNRELEHDLFLRKLNSEILHFLISPPLDLKKISKQVLNKTINVLHARGGSIHIFEEKKNILKLKAHHSVSKEFLKKRDEVSIGEGLIGKTAFHKEPVFLKAREIYTPEGEKKSDFKLKGHSSLIIFPILETQKIEELSTIPSKLKGKLVGVITLFSPENKSFIQKDLLLLGTLTHYIALGLKNAIIFEQTRQLAIHDGLTNIYNHIYFQELLSRELSRSQRHKTPLSLALIDIDYFKEINDTYGHQEGDLILKELSRIFKNSFRKTDIVSRYGGDEFSIIFPETELNSTLILMKKLHEKINNNLFQGEKHKHKITLSSGISNLDPHTPVSSKTLIGRADQALYQAKSKGRNMVKIWKIKRK